MALSNANKAAVRRFLGFPDVNRQGHYALEGALISLSADGETIVTGLLTQLATIQTALTSSWSRQKVLVAEEITLAGPGEIQALRAEGRRLAGELAGTLDIEIHRDVFSSGNGAAGVCRRG